MPVMLHECIDALQINKDGIYVDVTFGGGGHSKEILKHLSNKGVLVAFDQDEDAKNNLPADKRLVFIDQNFAYIHNHLHYQGLLPVNGILADLGVSSHQFDEGTRGFSFRFDDAALDMRMSATAKANAAAILNTYSAEQLANVLYQYGELKNSRALATAIVNYRQTQTVQTVAHLKAAIANFTPKFNEYKFYAPIFQALRIEVNQELEVLKSFLQQTAEVLAPGGILAVMSYHSLEDRLVKNFINSGNFNGDVEKDFFGNAIKPFDVKSKKAIVPTNAEINNNPRARSAKLRVAVKN